MLLTDAYNTYVLDTIKLVKSFVIKSLQTIDSINSFLTLGGDILSDNPKDWKYYRNLAGLPYVGTSGYFNDPIITVYSLDSGTMVPFTPESMANNPITLADFRTFGTAYNNLLMMHPTQDMLIRGVLHPIDMDRAINAASFEIIGYDSKLLGEGELHLIMDIQKWINSYVVRWNVTAFALSDIMYPGACFAILILNLIPVILNIRLSNCKTDSAHEFHIWNYLAGYFNLDAYKGVIPYQQALFLYRNIDYITANAGKADTLDFLNSGFAFPFGLQLFSHDIRQDIGNSLASLNSGSYKDIVNEVKINMYPYGTSNQVTDTTRFFTPAQTVEKLKGQALLNPINIEEDTQALIEHTLKTPATEIPTGIIECNVIRTSTVNMVSKASEQIHNWLFMASRNFINYKYSLVLPSEGIAELNITAQDAAVMLMYATAKYYGVTLVNIPEPMVRDIMYIPPLTEYELKGLVEPQYLTGSVPGSNPLLTWDRYQDISTAITLPKSILSVDEFLTYINKVVANKVQHRLLPTLADNYLAKDEVRFLVKAFYENVTCKFVAETTYAEFFARLGVDLSGFSPASLKSLIDIISEVYIGLYPATDTLQEPYASMVDILRTVSSYMLQFVDGPATNNIDPLGWDFPDPSMSGLEVKEASVLIKPGVDNYFYEPIVKSIGYDVVMDINTEINANVGGLTGSVIKATTEIGTDITAYINLFDSAVISPVGVFPKAL